MIRIIAGICFSISVATIFYKKSKYFIDKGKFLSEVIAFILYVKDSVRYTRADVLTIKKLAAEKFSSLIFLSNGVKNNCFGYEKEIDLLINSLGKSDIQGQIDLCDRNINYFRLLYEKEKAEIEKNSKTYGALGLFIASALIVIFV